MLEETISQVAIENLLVNNLFQLDDGRWRASLRSPNCNQKGEFFFEMGHGLTADDALAEALATARKEYKTEAYQGRVAKRDLKIQESVDYDAVPVEGRSIEEVQAELGLEQPIVNWEDL